MTEERLDGVLVVDKPAGMTSHDVVVAVRRTLKRVAGSAAKRVKVGHAGTLDPSATGVLLVCVGRATRLVPYLQSSDKRYRGTIVLGAETTSLDADGELVAERDASGLAEAAVHAALDRAQGDIEQVPPMVSAVKVGGERLYAKARRGEEVERAARRVTIHEARLVAFRAGARAEADVDVTCSPGTYIRTLAADVGTDLGVGGHLRALRRVASGRFEATVALPLDRVTGADSAVALRELMMPLHEAVADYPARRLDDREAAALRHGRALAATGVDGPVAALEPGGALLAMIADREGLARPLAVLAA